MLEDLTQGFLAFSPQALQSRSKLVCLWRVQQTLLGALSFVVLGMLSFSDLMAKAAELRRHFLDSPRRRAKQAPKLFRQLFSSEGSYKLAPMPPAPLPQAGEGEGQKGSIRLGGW